MAKKTRRPNLPQETLERARRELERSGVMPTEHAVPEASTVPTDVVRPKPALLRRALVTTTADLRAQYAYVILDLEKMAMLAAGIMAVLIVLSFFI